MSRRLKIETLGPILGGHISKSNGRELKKKGEINNFFRPFG